MLLKLKVKAQQFLFVIDGVSPPEESVVRNNDTCELVIMKSCNETDYRATQEIYEFAHF